MKTVQVMIGGCINQTFLQRFVEIQCLYGERLISVYFNYAHIWVCKLLFDIFVRDVRTLSCVIMCISTCPCATGMLSLQPFSDVTRKISSQCHSMSKKTLNRLCNLVVCICVCLH